MSDVTPIDLETVARAYLDAFRNQDLECCLGYFAEDASLDFHLGKYRGLDAIRTWHLDRWSADLEVLRVDSVHVRGNTVTVDALVASDRLKAWKIAALNGRVAIRFDSGKIRDAKFSPRIMSPVEMIRSDS